MALNNHSERAHAMLSASSAHRWLHCPPSAVAAVLYRNEGTEFTREGTLAHVVAEIEARAAEIDGIPIHELESDKEIPQEMIEHAKDYAAYIQEQITGADHVLLLEQRVDFSPWVPHGFGTCDCILIQGTTMDIIDYKYGMGVQVDAQENEQLMLYALGAINDFGIAYDIETVNMHIFQPRIGNVSTWSASADDLLNWAEKTVKRIADQAAEGKGKYKAGAWCKFCPHAGKCRTLTKTCTEYAETHDLRVAVPKLAPHEVAEVLKMKPLIELWLKRVSTQALDSLLEGEEIPGFKCVEGKMGNRKWTDELAVAEKLQAEGYDQADFTETKLLSPAAMDKALGKKKVAELLDSLISRAPGAPTVVPESDKRPTYDRAAEFDTL